ncbi:acyl-CoA dehydrogenase family protein [Fodinisporobacter ferrooxydans]|uniref:Acyl-CoA dehydrogenase family protein n=1 Tax=Fodinisporobacter ferrooxydans TaxID=2901836 RepID=A0ABY4CHZ0_9BACL|nr:acyl-CoA dehydrogenase family protein [Alicyclobacillaceae bacterium MYW30-H2]
MIQFSEELQQIARTVQKFVDNEVEPYANQIEETDHVPEHLLESAKQLGLYGMGIPEEYGGLGLGVVGKSLVLEKLGRTHNGFASIISAHTGIGSIGIVRLGSEYLKEKYLPDLAEGKRLAAFALSEPEAGSDATNIKTRAEKRGDRWILNGMKHFITNGPYADVFTVIAVNDPSKGIRGGFTAFAVEKDFPGFKVGATDKKMGLRGSHTAQLFFEDCAVPAENVIGEVGMGYASALKILAEGRCTLAARSYGSCLKLIELATEYAKQRIQFGKPIANNQGIQWILADMATETEVGRAFNYQVAQMFEQGQKVIKEAAMTKLFATETFNRVADRALQIFGGVGYMKEYAVERFYRDARITKIYEGTNEIQKNIIAAQLLKE